jgi:hypothetical protein
VIPIEPLLYKSEKPISKIDFPSLVFYAEAEAEPFQDVTVITLQSHYVDVCYDCAMEQAENYDDVDEWATYIQERAFGIMDSGQIIVQEFVDVKEDRSVVIAMDADTITDEVVDLALGYLSRAKMPGLTFFGNHNTYRSETIKGFTNATTIGG